MARSPLYTQFPLAQAYSEIIDVRSEGEFAEDCIPGALNFPVLNDEERAKVGTIYHQDSPFAARKLGAALVAKNISRHLETHFASKSKTYEPLVYCWRGGQRSNSLALVLSQIGWQVTVIEGGYKTYRRYVREQLMAIAPQLRYRVLCGLTGSGKTYLLQRLRSRGEQVLDLEGLANHRGSLLGQVWEERPEPQPSQKYFESLLLPVLQSFNPQRSVWVESESNKIGEVHVPNQLWQALKQANCVEVEVAIAARVDWLLQEYPHLIEHPDYLKNKLQRLESRYGKWQIATWYDWIDRGCWRELVQNLLETHYDPSYYRSMKHAYQREQARSLSIPDLSDASVTSLLDKLCALGLGEE